MPGPIPQLENIPSTSDPANFSANADDLLNNQLPAVIDAMNDVSTAMNLNATSGTSATSNSIGTGAKTFTADTGKSWLPGMFLVFADTAAPSTNSMTVQVTSYNTSTGELVVNSLATLGSGTKTAWAISQTMNPVPLDNSVGENALKDDAVTAGKIADAVFASQSESEARSSTVKFATPGSLQNFAILKSSTTKATNSGSSVDFTSSDVDFTGAKKIRLAISGFSTNGTSLPQIRIGTGGTPANSGYASGSSVIQGTPQTVNETTGIRIYQSLAASVTHINVGMTLVDASSNTWVITYYGGYSSSANTLIGGGSISLAGALDIVRILTADTFDSGSARIFVEK